MNQLTAPSIVRKFSQLLCTAASVVSMSLAVFPSTAQAAGADGRYRVISSKGSFIEDGETPLLAESAINQIAKDQSAAIVVKGLNLKINRNITGKFFQSWAKQEGFTMNSKVTGPSSIALVPTGNYFTGKSLQPIVTKLSYIYKGNQRFLTVKTNVVATVKGRSLTLTTSFSGVNGDTPYSGVITIVGKR